MKKKTKKTRRTKTTTTPPPTMDAPLVLYAVRADDPADGQDYFIGRGHFRDLDDGEDVAVYELRSIQKVQVQRTLSAR